MIAAFHEASHVVVAWALGVEVGGINIADDASGDAEISNAQDHLPMVDRVAICVAGNDAMDLFDIHAHVLSGISDHARVAALLEEYSDDEGLAFRNAGYKRARQLLVRHRDRVVRIAEALIISMEIDRSILAGMLTATA